MLVGAATVRDPVCGMPVDPAGAPSLVHDGTPYHFCSEYCLNAFRWNPVVSGSDLWLNTPRRPLEASGTSGMKAAHNGVPSLSVLDGWWLEGHIEGVTGWSIGGATGPASDLEDAEDLYGKLADAPRVRDDGLPGMKGGGPPVGIRPGTAF